MAFWHVLIWSDIIFVLVDILSYMYPMHTEVSEIIVHMKSHIHHAQEIARKIFLYNISLVATADHKLINAMSTVYFKDMREYRLASNLNHRLGLEM